LHILRTSFYGRKYTFPHLLQCTDITPPGNEFVVVQYGQAIVFFGSGFLLADFGGFFPVVIFFDVAFFDPGESVGYVAPNGFTL